MPWWRRSARVETRDYWDPVPHIGPTRPLLDPGLAEYLGYGGSNAAGVSVSESSALGLTSVWRAVNIIAGTVAGMPLKSYRDGVEGEREPIPSVWDDPGAGLFTPYEFVHVCMVQLVLHGNAFLKHVYNGLGMLVGFFPVHPSCVQVRFADGMRVFKVTLPGLEEEDLTEADMTQVMYMSTDGLTGVSPLRALREAFGTGIAANDAAARQFSSGLMASMILGVDGVDEEQAADIQKSLNKNLSGTQNAGKIGVINSALTPVPFTMTNEDAQFLESRSFQVEEVSRALGIPKVLLAEDGASTWGSGIAELDRGMARYTFNGYTKPFEQRGSLYVQGGFCEFEYDGLLEPNPQQQSDLLIAQVEAGLRTVNEARKVLNLPPVPDGDAISATPPLGALPSPAETRPQEA